MAVLAVQTIRRMRGGAQSQLMLGADGALWVVKFRNNPQGERVLANELLATRIAEAVGLTVPKTEIVEVSEWLVANSPEMTLEFGRGQRGRCAAGLQFGSRFVGGLMPGQVVDYLPESQLAEVRNLGEFAGRGNGSTGPRLSIRDSASMRESGAFRTCRCAASMRETLCTWGLQDGTVLSPG